MKYLIKDGVTVQVISVHEEQRLIRAGYKLVKGPAPEAPVEAPVSGKADLSEVFPVGEDFQSGKEVEG